MKYDLVIRMRGRKCMGISRVDGAHESPEMGKIQNMLGEPLHIDEYMRVWFSPKAQKGMRTLILRELPHNDPDVYNAVRKMARK